MAARKVLVAFAVLALGVGITASVATAFSPCGHRACSDEVAASGFSGQARGACLRQVIADCRAGLCSCRGGSPPCSCACGDGLCGPSEDCSTCPQDCGPCPTATTTTTTLPCKICFGTVTHVCGGPCSTDFDCGPPPLPHHHPTYSACPSRSCGASASHVSARRPPPRPPPPVRRRRPPIAARRTAARAAYPAVILSSTRSVRRA